MNVNDAASEALPACWLTLFTRQRMLMERYHPIEAASGLQHTSDVPVALDTPRGQAQLKDFAWRVTEELAEAYEAFLEHPHPEQAQPHEAEELADAVHFLVELCILADVQHDHLFEMHLVSLPLAPSVAEQYMLVVLSVGKAMNCLKQKPWKQTHQLTDKARFHGDLQQAAVELVRLFLLRGHDSASLTDLYLRKSQVNQFRQRSHY